MLADGMTKVHLQGDLQLHVASVHNDNVQTYSCYKALCD